MRTFLRAVVHLTKRGLAQLQHVLVDAPLQQLYFRGPLLAGYGFWAGAAKEDMCAVLSPGTSAFFWTQNSAQCEALLQQRVDAFCIAIKFALYLLAMYRLIHWISFQVFVLRPVLRRVDAIMGTQGMRLHAQEVVTQAVVAGKLS
jgi:hypothetical protein